jgi:phospholipid/cholesterol/gamma-HCH transport system substrate-binding protein
MEGNNVRLRGIDVGTVKEINIVTDTLVEVEMMIRESARDFIKKDATATVATDGLMGNRIVNINGGDPSTPKVSDGDMIFTKKQVNTEDILRTVDNASQYTAVLSAELVKMVNSINAGNGPLGVILRDTLVSINLKNTISDLQETSRQSVLIAAHFKQILRDVNNGNGAVGAAINDTLLRGNLVRTLSDLEMAANNLQQTTENLHLLSQRIDKGHGTISTLMNDTAFANDLKMTILSAKAGTEGFNQNMQALKHNFLLRPYFKKQEKNNAE